MKTIIIGDSHSSLYSDEPQRNRGVWSDITLNNKFDVRWLGPFTFWRLCRDGKSFIDLDKDIYYDNGSSKVSTKCNEGCRIMFVFGEIDVRCNILKFGYDNYEKTIDNMIGMIGNYMKHYKDRFDIHIQSIVPTIYHSNFGNKTPLFPFVGDDNQRKEVTLYFNESLKQLCRRIGLGYFDIFDLYSDSNSMLKLDKSDNIVHGIKTLELEKYIKEYFSLKNN